jgi:Restriction endonuclease
MALNNGKELESLVRLIQETLKDSPNTLIYNNSRLTNESGRKREIDLLIETKVNNFNIKIAIECKDFKRPISAEKIEAFESKCKRIKGIDKKVFVSSNGYQKDAMNAANAFGIELYNVKDIDSSTILDWFPIKQLGLRVTLKDYKFALIASEQEIEFMNSSLSSCCFIFEGEKITDLNLFVFEHIKEYKHTIWAENIHNFMKTGGNKDQIGKICELPFNIVFSNVAYIRTQDDRQFEIKEMAGNLNTWLVISNPQKITSKSFNNHNRVEAKYVSIDDDKFGKVEFIFTPNNRKMFYTNTEGVKAEMKHLASYNPQTDKFTLSNP